MLTLRFALAVPAVLLLPGLAFAPSALTRRRLDGPLLLAWALGASPALWALAFLWTSLVGLRWGPPQVQLALLALAGIAWLRLRPAPCGGRRRRGRGRLATSLAAMGIVAVALWLRLGEAEGLVAAPWVDGYHHTVITQLFSEQHGLPRDYRPYLEADGFDYHFGFHGLAALLSWLTGVEARTAVLWLGQILCALVPVSLLLLARQLGMGWLGALAAQALAAAWLWFPPYYLSWGRYTQLTGLLVLPAALWVWQRAWRHPAAVLGGAPRRRVSWWDATLAGFLAAGLMLTHYRVAAFFLLAVAVLSLGQILPKLPPARALQARWSPSSGLRLRSLRPWYEGLPGLVWPPAAALLFGAPWLARGFGERLQAWWSLPRTASAAAERGAAVPAAAGFDFPDWVLIHHEGGFWLRLALLGLLVALLTKRRGVGALTAWLALALLFTWPGLWGSGQSWALPSFALAISLWMPIALGAGWLAEALASILASGRRSAATWGSALACFYLALSWHLRGQGLALGTDAPALAAAGAGMALLHGARADANLRRWGAVWPAPCALALALLGAWRMPAVLNEETVILRAAELPAAAWIRAHTPDDARFFIGQKLWNQGAYRGVDGGYWLPLTAGRSTTVPLAVYALRDAEQVHALESRARVLAQGDDLSDAEILDLLRRARASWVYVQRVAEAGPGRLSAERLARVAGLGERYQDDAVRLFELETTVR